MIIEELHFELKRRCKKNYTNFWRGLSDAEADQILNAAIQDYVEMFSYGRNDKNFKLGFEVNQQRTDMLATLLVGQPEQAALTVTSENTELNVYEFDLSNLKYDYRRYVRAKITCEECQGLIGVHVEDSGDLNTVLNDANRKPSLSWRRAVGQIRKSSTGTGGKSLYIYTEGEFTPDKLYLEYIKEPNKVCLGTYSSIPTVDVPEPTNIKPKVECDLPQAYHELMLKIAVQTYGRNLENYNKAQSTKAQILDVSS
jgi:hypothetical protein